MLKAAARRSRPSPNLARNRFPDLRLDFSGSAARDFQAIQIRSRCPAGAVLFAQHSEPMGLYVVLRGTVQMAVHRPGKPDLVVRVAGKGEALGVIATMSNQPYVGTASAVGAAEIAFVPRVAFLKFLLRHPEARVKVMEFLTREVSGAYQHVRALAAAKLPRV